MKILVTGGAGFLGWHVRSFLHATSDHVVVSLDRHDWGNLPLAVADGVDGVVHLAGINRALDEEVEFGNHELAHQLAAAIRSADRPVSVVYSNSIHAETDTPYGRGKAGAAAILAEATAEVGGAFSDVRLPNLFGEHGLPNYNSFVATFADGVVNGSELSVSDREVELLHAQDAARLLVERFDHEGHSTVTAPGTLTRVEAVLRTLQSQFEVYKKGDIPPLASRLDVQLFNTLRAAMFPTHYPIPLIRRTDERGSLVETVRAHGSEGQAFISTTKPGVTRGQHFHLRKFERFAVVSGRARISLRKVLTDEVIDFDVDGENPVIVDMPILWAHKITNTGEGELTTVFWTNELFDPNDTDTFPEEV